MQSKGISDFFDFYWKIINILFCIFSTDLFFDGLTNVEVILVFSMDCYEICVFHGKNFFLM